MGLPHSVRGVSGDAHRAALPRQVLLHSRESRQDHTARLDHILVQAHTHLVLVQVLYDQEQVAAEGVSQELQALLHTQSLQLLLRLLPRLVRVLHANDQVEPGRSVLHAATGLQHLWPLLGEERSRIHKLRDVHSHGGESDASGEAGRVRRHAQVAARATRQREKVLLQEQVAGGGEPGAESELEESAQATHLPVRADAARGELREVPGAKGEEHLLERGRQEEEPVHAVSARLERPVGACDASHRKQRRHQDEHDRLCARHAPHGAASAHTQTKHQEHLQHAALAQHLQSDLGLERAHGPIDT